MPTTIMHHSIKAYIPGLTGLRGVAAMGVFLVHYNQIVLLDPLFGPFDLYSFLANGEYGVGLFFSLSGFLLSLPYWQSKTFSTSFPNTLDYCCNRIVRIVPAYFFSLTVLILFYSHWVIPGVWPDILLHYSFFFNLTEFSIFSLNPSFWTLAVEMQFYCLLPLFFYIVRRLPPSVSLALLVITAILSYFAHLVLITSLSQTVPWPLDARLLWIRPNGAVLNYSLFAHLPHFIIGILYAYCFLWLREYSKKRPVLVEKGCEVLFWSVSFFVLTVLAMPHLLETLQLPSGRYGLPLIPLLMSSLLLVVPFTRYTVQLLEWAPIKAFGVLSYSFYLFHHPVLQWTDRGMAAFHLNAPDHQVVFGFTSFSVATLAALLTYTLIERPAVQLWKKL